MSKRIPFQPKQSKFFPTADMADPVPPPPVRERVKAAKINQIWFRIPLVALPGNPVYIGSGQGWDHVVMTAHDFHVRVEWKQLAVIGQPTRIICLPYDSVVAYELAPQRST